jgi:MFS family permease
MDYLGRRPIQIGGFAILVVIFCIIGFGYNVMNRSTLLALYILAQFFFNFGPNTTTFIVPGECFPTRYRSTGHGLSAASGKVGATIAQLIAPPLLSQGAPKNCQGSECSPWLNHLMEIFALFMFCGFLVSFLVPETKRQTLEVLAGEAPLPKSRGSSPILQEMEGHIPSGNVKAWRLWDKKGGSRKARKKDDDDDYNVGRVQSGVSMESEGVWRLSALEREDFYGEGRMSNGNVLLREMDIGELRSVLT